jgi:endonuclease YncB( thermonuclease family)
MRQFFPRMGMVLLAHLCLLASASLADERDFSGVATRVFDGDSFIVTSARTNERIEVRLLDIDAPEKGQPYADQSRAALIQLIEGRRVFVDVVDTDRYERKVAKVYREPDRLEVARALVHDGHAWVNRKYAKDKTLTVLEDAARAKRTGMWSLPRGELVPPWEFRAGMKNVYRRKKGAKGAKGSDSETSNRTAF